MARYLLDTNIVCFAFDASSPHGGRVLSRLARLDDADEACVSILTLYELRYSLANLPPGDLATGARIRQAIASIRSSFALLPLSPAGADLFGRMKAAYQSHFGVHRGAMRQVTIDIMIAAQAVEHGAVLVSHDAYFPKLSRAFPACRVQDWAD